MSFNHNNGFQRIKSTSLNFVNLMKIGEKSGIYRKEKDEGESFYGSYHAAHILDLFGELQNIPEADKDIWAHNFTSRQSAQGYFSSDKDNFLKNVTVDEMEPYWHYTRGNIWALRLLGRKPQHSFGFLEPLLNTKALYKWVKKYDWSNSWAAGNQVLACATALFALRDWFGFSEADKIIEYGMYPALEELLDEKTGFWGTQFNSGLQNGLFGTIHITPVYFAQGWPLRSVEANIDSTLKCQLPDGSFWPGGSDCPDFDGAYMMANLHALTDYRKEDLQLAARKYLDHALMHEDPKGCGWLLHRKNSNPSDWKPRPHWIWKNGTDRAIAELRDEDPERTHIMLGSWFYPLSIALIAKMLEDTDYDGPYHFNKNSLHVCNVPSLINS